MRSNRNRNAWHLVNGAACAVVVMLFIAYCAPATVYESAVSSDPVQAEFVQSTGVKLDAFALSSKIGVRVSKLAASRGELSADDLERVLDAADEVSTGIKKARDGLVLYEQTLGATEMSNVQKRLAEVELGLATVLSIAGPYLEGGDE